MTTVLDEARRATFLYQAMLTRLGAIAAASVFRTWQGTAQPLPDTGREAWRLQAATIVDNSSTVAGRVAIAYYQLLRALITGATITGPGQVPSSMTLGELRAQWERLTRTPYGDRTTPDGTRIGLEVLDDFNDRHAARRAAALDQVERIIAGTAVDTANLRVDQAGPGTDLGELHVKAGESVAAAADRIAKGGGRGAVWDSLKSDPRALGYARISSDPPPCYWCAILISQGRAYTSKQAAQIGADGNRYHDHCACIAVPLFSKAQFEGSEFDTSRTYRGVWNTIAEKTEDSYEARRIFRRWIESGGDPSTVAALVAAL